MLMKGCENLTLRVCEAAPMCEYEIRRKASGPAPPRRTHSVFGMRHSTLYVCDVCNDCNV